MELGQQRCGHSQTLLPRTLGRRVYINSPAGTCTQSRASRRDEMVSMNEFFIRDPFLFVIALNELKYGRAIQLIFRCAHSGGTPMDKKTFMETHREHRANRIKWTREEETANQGLE
jgi:hypothetical protein